MPTRFRRNVWIKRGDFVAIERIEEGVKVQGEIARILYKDHIDQLKKEGVWPAAFAAQIKEKEETRENSDSDEDNDDDLFVNTNRRQPIVESSNSSSEEEED